MVISVYLILQVFPPKHICSVLCQFQYNVACSETLSMDNPQMKWLNILFVSKVTLEVKETLV